MSAYSLDLRTKIVAAKQREMSTGEVARDFGLGLSSVKRYTETAREAGHLRPMKHTGRLPIADERAKKHELPKCIIETLSCIGNSHLVTLSDYSGSHCS
jgi:transposase